MKSRATTVSVFDAHALAPAFHRRVAARARTYLRALHVSGAELSVALVGDGAIRALNRRWRRKDIATDVLSFPGGEAVPGDRGPRQLGDVIISLDTAARVAAERGRPIREEVDRYLAHGLLHLLGHEHHRASDARRMAAEEARLLGGQGLVPSPR